MHPSQIAPSRPMSSSNGTSPTTTDSPPVLTPATPSSVNKPLAPMPGSANAPTISLNKTWVLPPKPKPGRKPAIDTPPTKRKAQNREAQRAFRERRAAKVGELEDEMKKVEEEHAEEQSVLKDRIRQLERNVQNFGEMVEMWREKFNEMQIAYGRERQSREQAEFELSTLRKGVSASTEAIPLPRRAKEYDYLGAQQPSGTPNVNQSTQGTKEMTEVGMTCGKCTDDTRCQCIEEAFEMSTIADDTCDQPFKRPPSNPSNTDTKRIRRSSVVNESVETDFTAQFSTRRPPNLTTSSSTASSAIQAIAPPSDPCGFCTDGTLCICAEMAKDNSRQQLFEQQTSNRLSPEISNPCINGPGTCAQCLSNPTSTLFCKSVAANCPPASNGNAQSNLASAATSPSQQPRLTCADAFTTLSRHPGFSAATNELNSWVPQLTALPKLPAAPVRTAFDIEAASVMSVLKMFDRRFGADGGPLGVGEGPASDE